MICGTVSPLYMSIHFGLQGTQSGDLESHHLRLDGNLDPHLQCGRSLLGPSGCIVAYLLLRSRDNAERQEQERRFRSSPSRMQEVTECQLTKNRGVMSPNG